MRRLIGVLAGVVASLVLLGALTVPVGSGVAPAERTEAEAAASFAPLSAIRYSKDGRITIEPEFESNPRPVTRIGVFDDDDTITLANMTVTPGQYVIGFTFESLVRPSVSTSGFRCGVADSNGRAGVLFESPELVSAADGWQRLTYVTPAGLPDITLALGCSPVDAFAGMVSFRDVEFAATRAP